MDPNINLQIQPHAAELLFVLQLIEGRVLDPGFEFGELLKLIRELLFLGDGTFFTEFFLG